MISHKITMVIIAVVILCFFVLYTVDELGLIGSKQPLVISSQTIVSQLQKFDIIFEAGWWPHVTDNNRIVLLGVLFAILIAGVITLAITDRQISRMTMQFKRT